MSAGTSEQVRLILEAAEHSATELRTDAGRQAGEHVEHVQQAAERLLAGIDGLERELGELLDSLRQSGRRLSEGLAGLQADVGELAPPGAPAAAEEDFAAAAPEASPAVEPPPAADAAPAAADGDEAGARLIALNMALSGTPREETAAYLGEHFALADADGLLDDVYARAAR
jgi:hypothetical protein